MRSEAPGELARLQVADRDALLPELLHALIQPLTALRCSLEATLLTRQESEEYREELQESLKLTEEVMSVVRGIQEMLDVEKPPGSEDKIALDEILSDTVRDLFPLSDGLGVGLTLLCMPRLLELGDSTRFRRAVSYLRQSELTLAQPADEINVQAGIDPLLPEVRIEVCRHGMPSQASSLGGKCSPSSGAQLGLLIARRIFEVAGGRVEIDREDHQITWRIRLPITCAERKDPAAAASRPEVAR